MASKVLSGRLRRKQRVRKKVFGTGERPRLTVFRSSKHIYAQIIDDQRGVTLAAAASVEKSIAEETAPKTDVAKKVGALVAQRAKEANVEKVVFDRNGYPYNSPRVRALAEAAREVGLQF